MQEMLMQKTETCIITIIADIPEEEIIGIKEQIDDIHDCRVIDVHFPDKQNGLCENCDHFHVCADYWARFARELPKRSESCLYYRRRDNE